MFKKLKRFIDLLQWKFAILKQKIKHPKERKHTLMCLAAGYTLEEMDEQIQENESWYGFRPNLSTHQKREEHCEIEVSYWEE